MKKYTKMVIGVFCALLMMVAAANAATTNAVVKSTNAPVAVQTVTAPAVFPPAEAWVLSLNGAGTTTTKNSTTGFGMELGVGRTGNLLLPMEAGLRQGITYSSANGTIASTKLYSDWTLFTVKKFDLFTGANIGCAYGNTPLSWQLAPEAGVRYWLKKDIAVVGRMEYPLSINDNWFTKQDRLNYTVGFSVKF